MKKEYRMSKVNNKNTALVLTSTEQALLDSPTSYRFMELTKACGIDAEVTSEVPEFNKAKTVDCILVDLSQVPLKGHMTEQVLSLTDNTAVVFFNADEQTTCESSVLLSGVKGIFYKEDRPDLILRGLESITKRESWFKRSTMNKAVSDLLKLKQRSQVSNNTKAELNLPQLTKREQTIVHLVSSGAQNKEIAEQLHISPNTVKTHIYSLFRKTSSRNRIELITWSQQFNSARLLNS